MPTLWQACTPSRRVTRPRLANSLITMPSVFTRTATDVALCFDEDPASPVILTSAGATTVTCVFTGLVQHFVIPDNVYLIRLDLIGAQGGGPSGGPGCEITGTLAVVPGDVLDIYVGGQPSGSAGGWGGTFGGNGGTGSYPGFGGGGSTEVWLNGSCLLSAPGGGGMAGLASGAPRSGSGGPGGLTGGPGSGSPLGACGAGGVEGTPGAPGSTYASDGANGSGANGGNGNAGDGLVGGGGGGGGGGYDASGGGGASGGVNGSQNYYPAGGGGAGVYQTSNTYILASVNGASIQTAPYDGFFVNTISAPNTSGNGSAVLSVLPLPRASVTTPSYGAAEDLATGFTVAWNYLAGTPGNSQLGYALRIRQVGSSSFAYFDGTDFSSDVTFWNICSATSASVGASVSGGPTTGASYLISVACWDQDGLGNFSPEVTVVSATPPTVAITSPANDSVLTLDTCPAITWAYTPSTETGAAQQKYQVWVYPLAITEGGGFTPGVTPGTVGASGLVVSAATTYSLWGGAITTASATFVAYIQVTDTNNTTSSIESSTFEIVATPPAAPTLTVVSYSDPVSGVPGLKITVVWVPGVYSTASLVTVALYYSDDGTNYVDSRGRPQLIAGSGQEITAAGSWTAVFINHLLISNQPRHYRAVVTVTP